MRNPRPEQRCALCGEARVLKRGLCSGCTRPPRGRTTLSTADAKLAGWGDVEGQEPLFEVEG